MSKMAGDFRLSLVAQYDDLVRNGRVLNQGIETEFLRFVNNQELCLKKWAEEEGQNSDLNHKVKNLSNENNALETRLKHARSQIDHEIRKRKQIEQEKEDLERQVLLVRELLNGKDKVLSQQDREKLHFLSTDFQFSNYEHSPKRSCRMKTKRQRNTSRGLNTIDESADISCDISYDKTEEDLEVSDLRYGRKWKRPRPSAPPPEVQVQDSTPEKTPRRSKEKRRSHRSRHRRSNSAVITASVNIDETGEVQAEAEVDAGGRKQKIKSPRRSLKKYASANNVRDTDSSDDTYNRNRKSPQALIKELNDHLASPAGTPGIRRVNSAGRTFNRPHQLVERCNTQWNEICIPCGRKIGFGKYAMKCKECRACAHIEHKDDLPLPCVPSSSTPNTKNVIGVLADYAPLESPMIPAIVIHCVNEIEHRGLHEAGIYRVPGSEREVKELKEKFMKNKGAPYLSNVNDIHVVCGCLKDFMRGLKEPVTTYELWHDFCNAAEMSDEECQPALYQAISQLPQANRDTLAFLMLHLQRVAESIDTKMNVPNLARVFGPTLVGFSSPNVEPLQMVNDTRRSHMVVERLMRLSADYWESFINVMEELSTATHFRDVTNTPQTPEMQKTCDYESILGPIGTPTPGPPSHETSARKGWLTTPSRFGTRGRSNVSKKPNHFFASPTLK